ncbi:MAG: aminodeoxychorismate synthase component I [Dokdonella sp.]|uniref:aminodeoxychorismate synthase component I n=1 Tax=Dokdonella sp. TaxID=2291710 RepID=UPI0032655840
MSTIVRTVGNARDLLPLAASFPARYPGFLESVARGSARARHDILFAFPEQWLRLGADGHVRDRDEHVVGTSFLAALDEAWQAERLSPDMETHGLPFRGGWLLYLGYELAAEIEPSLRLPPSRDAAMPIALALRCPAAIIVDHQADRTWLVAEKGREELIDLLQADLDVESTIQEIASIASCTVDEDAPALFLDGVERIQRHLADGDVFQVNLSREWRAHHAESPRAADLYAALRRANPAPFAGLLQTADWAIVSSSPERLIEIRGEVVQTRPIAGTRARVDDDVVSVRELVGHPKERAEHVMLIDLERNDLGRICRPGSVVVDELMGVESYAHVHHIVSNVRGLLHYGVTPGDAIRAVFPGGTITGCPKVRCMQIIADIERVGRGAYTGSFGYLNRDGDLDLNILIRTLTLQGDCVHFRAGAGIVADSQPQQELEETRAKARGLLHALNAVSN